MKLIFLTVTALLFTVISRLAPPATHANAREVSSVEKIAKH